MSQITNQPIAGVAIPTPLPDFVADIINAEIIRRWVEYLRPLSDSELREFVEKLYGSPSDESSFREAGTGGGTTIVFGPNVTITVPVTTTVTKDDPKKGGKPPKPPIPTTLPADAGTR